MLTKGVNIVVSSISAKHEDMSSIHAKGLLGTPLDFSGLLTTTHAFLYVRDYWALGRGTEEPWSGVDPLHDAPRWSRADQADR